MAPISPDALDRWTYRKDGMDYGPFSTHDICEMLRRREIAAQTEVFGRRARQWQRVEEIPKFQEFIATLVEEKRQEELRREDAAIERTIVVSRKAPYALLVTVVAVVGVVAFVLLRMPSAARAGFPAAFFRDLAFASLPLYKADEVQARPVDGPAKPDLKAVTHRPGARRGPGPGGGMAIASDGGQGAVEVDLSFDADEAGVAGKTLSEEDLDGVQKRAAPGLIRCFRQEVALRPDFQGGTVSLYLMNRGDVRVSKLATTPPPSADLVSCARGSVAGIRVPPFGGPIQVMAIPIHIGESR